MAKLNVKKTKVFWLYHVLGGVLIAASIILAPIWGFWEECPWKDWGSIVVSFAIAALLCWYLFGYLIKKLIRSKGTIKILTIIEFVLLFLIALGLVFSQFKILNIPDSPSVILGIALYCRGVIEIFRAYYHQKSSTYKYSVGWLVCAILLVTLGVFLFSTNIVTELMVLITLVVVLLVMGIVSIIYGVLSKPKSTKSKKE